MTNNTIDITAYGHTYTCRPQLGTYENGRLAISFVDAEGPYGTLTVNMPNDRLEESEFWVKDWSENEPMVLALLEAGWIEYTQREVQAGFCIAKAAKAKGPLLDFIRGQHTPGF